MKRKGGPYYHGCGGELKSLGQTCTEFFPKAGRCDGVLVKISTILLDLSNLSGPVGPPRGRNHYVHNDLLSKIELKRMMQFMSECIFGNPVMFVVLLKGLSH